MDKNRFKIKTIDGKIVFGEFERALDVSRRAVIYPYMRTKDNESIRSASGEYKGKEILFPTVRQRGPGIEKLKVKDAYKEAIKRRDYIEFDTPEQATAWSKKFSDLLGSNQQKYGIPQSVLKKLQKIKARK